MDRCEIDEELKAVKRGKNGQPYQMANSYVHLLSAVRYLYHMPYRQLEGSPQKKNYIG
jgi:hypothetical protein